MADTLQIDLKTRVWGPEERIFVLFPGEGYRFAADFQNRSLVYLDVPGLELPNGPGGEDYNSRLRLTAEVRKWHRQGRNPGSRPSRVIANHSNRALGQRLSLLAGQVNALYGNIRRGDLIIVPTAYPYYSDVLFGEVQDKAEDRHQIQSPDYFDENIMVRRVKWVARTPKHKLDVEFVRRLSTPNALTLLNRSLWEEALSISFENYAFAGDFSARFLTTQDAFSSLDSASINSFFTIIAAAVALQEEGETIEPGALNFEEALKILNRHPEYAPDLSININSPGDISQRNSYIVPLVTSALLAAALFGGEAARANSLQIVNSGAAHDPCAVLVDERVKQTIGMMGYDRWKAQCVLMKSTHRRTGFKTPATAHVLDAPVRHEGD